jgi:hypothetical protein
MTLILPTILILITKLAFTTIDSFGCIIRYLKQDLPFEILTWLGYTPIPHISQFCTDSLLSSKDSFQSHFISGLCLGIPMVDPYSTCFEIQKVMDAIFNVRMIHINKDSKNEHNQFHAGFGDVNHVDSDFVGLR